MDASSKKPRIRLWPAIVIAVLGLAVVVWIRIGGATGQEKFVRSFFTGVVTLALLVLWLVFLSRLRWWVRVLGILLLAAVFLATTQIVRIDGVTGDLVPILAWRWSEEAGESLPREALAAPGAAAERASDSRFDYPQFLGPDRDATVRGFRLARDWSTPPREVWRRPVGAGWSAFAVSGNLAVTQEQRGPDEMVVAYDVRTGEIRWTHADPARYETTVAGIGPRATPTVSDGRVYTLGATGILNALDLATGERLWSRDILVGNGARNPTWGKSCSPLAIDDLIVVSAGGPEDRSLVAYRRDTGEIVWHGGDDRSGYSSPVAATLAGVRQILIFNEGSLAAHAPESGELLWQYPWSAEQPNVAQPLPLSDDRLLVSSGYGVGSKLIGITRRDEGTFETALIWESPRLKAKFTNVVLHGGYVYGLDDGVLVCLDPRDGERCWKRGRYGHGQVILVEDLLLLTTEMGDVLLIDPNPDELVVLGRFSALKGKSWNSPALAGSRLLLRNAREAVCYELPLDS